MAGNTVLDGNSQYSRRCTEQSGGGSLAAFFVSAGADHQYGYAVRVWQRFAVWHPLQWMQEALWFRRALLWLR